MKQKNSQLNSSFYVWSSCIAIMIYGWVVWENPRKWTVKWKPLQCPDFVQQKKFYRIYPAVVQRIRIDTRDSWQAEDVPYIVQNAG